MQTQIVVQCENSSDPMTLKILIDWLFFFFNKLASQKKVFFQMMKNTQGFTQKGGLIIPNATHA